MEYPDKKKLKRLWLDYPDYLSVLWGTLLFSQRLRESCGLLSPDQIAFIRQAERIFWSEDSRERIEGVLGSIRHMFVCHKQTALLIYQQYEIQLEGKQNVGSIVPGLSEEPLRLV